MTADMKKNLKESGRYNKEENSLFEYQELFRNSTTEKDKQKYLSKLYTVSITYCRRLTHKMLRKRNLKFDTEFIEQNIHDAVIKSIIERYNETPIKWVHSSFGTVIRREGVHATWDEYHRKKYERNTKSLNKIVDESNNKEMAESILSKLVNKSLLTNSDPETLVTNPDYIDTRLFLKKALWYVFNLLSRKGYEYEACCFLSYIRILTNNNLHYRKKNKMMSAIPCISIWAGEGFLLILKDIMKKKVRNNKDLKDREEKAFNNFFS